MFQLLTVFAVVVGSLSMKRIPEQCALFLSQRSMRDVAVDFNGAEAQT